jgi:hypothetical protein
MVNGDALLDLMQFSEYVMLIVNAVGALIVVIVMIRYFFIGLAKRYQKYTQGTKRIDDRRLGGYILSGRTKEWMRSSDHQTGKYIPNLTIKPRRSKAKNSRRENSEKTLKENQCATKLTRRVR